MALRNRSRLRKPAACFLIHWMRELMASAVAFVMPLMMAFMIPSKCRRTVRATRTIGARRERAIQASTSFNARSARLGWRKANASMNVSLMAQARATLRLLDLSRCNSAVCVRDMFHGFMRKRCRVPVRRSSSFWRSADSVSEKPGTVQSGEVRGARWDEMDTQARVWAVPVLSKN